MKRDVTGSITLQYDWTPVPSAYSTGGGTCKVHAGLHGKLKVTVMYAEGILNLTYGRGKRSGSNAYCKAFCYPRSPPDRVLVCPSAWRSPVDVGTLSPQWHASHVFNFSWLPPTRGNLLDDSSKWGKEPGTVRSDGMFARSAQHEKGNVAALVQNIGRELMFLQAECRALNNRIASFSLTPEPAAEPG